jgi:hypothetical protein
LLWRDDSCPPPGVDGVPDTYEGSVIISSPFTDSDDGGMGAAHDVENPPLFLTEAGFVAKVTMEDDSATEHSPSSPTMPPPPTPLAVLEAVLIK